MKLWLGKTCNCGGIKSIRVYHYCYRYLAGTMQKVHKFARDVESICNLTLWCWVLLKRTTFVQPLKKFPTFYGTQRFITAFTRALYLSVSWARTVQSIPPHSISPRSILIPSALFLSSFHTDNLYAIFSVLIHAICPTPHLAKSTSYDPHFVFFILLSFYLSSVQIFSSAPCFQTPSVCVLL
jgi:hypothetical protein